MSVLIVLFDCYQILQAFELLRRVYIHQFLRHFGSHILDNVRMLAENMASASFSGRWSSSSKYARSKRIGLPTVVETEGSGEAVIWTLQSCTIGDFSAIPEF